MALSLKQKLVLGFGSSAIAIFAIGFIAFQAIDRMLESDRWVDHTVAVLSQLQDLEFNRKKAQSDFRGYLIVQNPRLLQSSEASMKLAVQIATDLQIMTSDNPRQRSSSDHLVSLVNNRWQRFQTDRDLCLSGRSNRVLAEVKRYWGGQADDEMDQAIRQMRVEEQNLLAKRRDTENNYAHTTLLILFLGGTAASVFIFASLLVINREVRLRTRVQELVQTNEYRLFQFLEAIPVGVFITDASGKPYYINQSGKDLIGRGVVSTATKEQLGEVYQSYLKDTNQLYPAKRSPLLRALKGEKSSVEDIEVRRPDGTVVPLEVWGTPVTDREGQVQYAITVFSDISERKNLEQMKESLISVVSHQLKTPVSEINGYIENLLDGLAGELNPRQKDYLLDMREIGMDNYQMISSLLSLSRLERGILKVEVSPIPLEEIVSYALRDYEKSIQRKGLNLTLKGIVPGLSVMADREKAVECLRNLINNALKFTDEGGISLEAEVKGGEVLLQVKDTGAGLSEAATKQLFSQKRVLGAEAARAGAGIGLYIVKQLMKLQGGDVTAESQAGKGACFTITFRRAS